MSPLKPTIAVVGGGITGLVSARALLESSDLLVMVLEAGGRVGGKIHTELEGGVRFEAGPDSFLARDRSALDLCDELGLSEQLVRPAVFGAYVWWRGRMHKMPESLYGIPASIHEARRSGLLGAWGGLRARLDLVRPGPLRGPDVSIGSFVKKRLGRQVLERMVDPLLAGTRAGDPDEMSLAAATPQIDQLARREGSVIKAFRAARSAGAPEGQAASFYGLGGGMQTLVDALASDVGSRAAIRTKATVEHISVGQHLAVYLDHGETIAADGIILAVPAYVAADILADVSRSARDELSEISYASVAVVTLVYPAGSVRPPRDGSGLLVPSREQSAVAACSWFDMKWPDAAPSDGRHVIRCVVGRGGDDPALELDDEQLVGRVAGDIARMLGASAEPQSSKVVRWDRAIPQYAVGHLERLERVQRALAPYNIVLAGAGYRGSGIPDCIRQAHAAVEQVLEPLLTA